MGISYLDYFNNLDIDEYDTVFVVSDVLKVIRQEQKAGVKFDGRLFLNSIKSKIKPHQTLIIPTYNWAFCHNIPFDYKNTPSAVGLLGNLALKDIDFRRTKHPIYSFAVYGKDRDMLCELDYKSAFCKQSIFGYIANTKSIQVGICINIYTIAHYVEEVEFSKAMDYRYEKDFTNIYIDENGNEDMKTYSMYVRDYTKNVSIDTTNLHNYVLDNGFALIKHYGNVNIYIMKISDLIQIVRNDLRKTGGMLYCTYDNQKGLG